MKTEKNFEISKVLLRLLSVGVHTVEDIPSIINCPNLSSLINKATQHNPTTPNSASIEIFNKELESKLNILNKRG